MPFTITEADIEKIIADNYWAIFHDDEDEPDYLKVYRQMQLSPYGVADIVVFYWWGDYDFPCIHVIEAKAVPLKEADLAQAARYLSGIRTAIGENPHKMLEPKLDGDGKVFDQYDINSNTTTTLVGPNDDKCGYPEGENGDFVFLQTLSDVEVYTFNFDINGLNFTYLSKTGWLNKGSQQALKNSVSTMFEEAQDTQDGRDAQESQRGKSEDKKLEDVPTLQGPQATVDQTAQGDPGTT